MRAEHNNNMPLNLEKPINLEMHKNDSRRHSITDRDSGVCHLVSPSVSLCVVFMWLRGRLLNS